VGNERRRELADLSLGGVGADAHTHGYGKGGVLGGQKAGKELPTKCQLGGQSR